MIYTNDPNVKYIWLRSSISFKMAPVAKGQLSDAEQKLMDAVLKGELDCPFMKPRTTRSKNKIRRLITQVFGVINIYNKRCINDFSVV